MVATNVSLLAAPKNSTFIVNDILLYAASGNGFRFPEKKKARVDGMARSSTLAVQCANVCQEQDKFRAGKCISTRVLD